MEKGKKLEKARVVKQLCYPAGVLIDEYVPSDNNKKKPFFRALSFHTRKAEALEVVRSAMTNGLPSISPL